MELTPKEKRLFPLSVAALGVVYGDIGTSPLYAFQLVLSGLEVNQANVLGVLSLIFWSLILVISTCYITIFLRADNHGEGGILALLSLLKLEVKSFPKILFLIGIIGAGLLLGDGMLTPAVSVLSAVEGLNLIYPKFSTFITPLSIAILFGLFFSQRFGTNKLGFTFGPFILFWFITLGALGLVAISENPSVLVAVNPYYAIKFFYNGGWHAFLLLSGIFLVITGAEAMYADLGHFGRKPIQITWFFLVFPMLVLNYFGQGAHLLKDPTAITHTFYSLSPEWFSLPLIIIATIATIIASQAVISASFSLANQAILLNISPRLSIIHTSEGDTGQVYVPQINFILGIGTLLLVAIFKNSASLAAAYGIAVNLVMIIVSILVVHLAYLCWKWPLPKIFLVFSTFIIIDFSFLISNSHKIKDGGWIPLLFAFCTATIMIIWNKGIDYLRTNHGKGRLNRDDVIREVENPALIPIKDLTAIFITNQYDRRDETFLYYLKLNHISPKEMLIVNVTIEDVPRIAEKSRYELKQIASRLYRLELKYGFMQQINVPKAINRCLKLKIIPTEINLAVVTYLVEMVNITITRKKYPYIFQWQKRLFAFLLRNSTLDIEFFHLPFDRTIAIGSYCEV